MVIALSPEQQQVVDRAIEVGMIQAEGDALELGLGTICQQLTTEIHSSNLSKEERKKALREWMDSFRADTPLLSNEAISRESIYVDRGLLATRPCEC